MEGSHCEKAQEPMRIDHKQLKCVFLRKIGKKGYH